MGEKWADHRGQYPSHSICRPVAAIGEDHATQDPRNAHDVLTSRRPLRFPDAVVCPSAGQSTRAAKRSAQDHLGAHVRYLEAAADSGRGSVAQTVIFCTRGSLCGSFHRLLLWLRSATALVRRAHTGQRVGFAATLLVSCVSDSTSPTAARDTFALVASIATASSRSSPR